MSESGPVRGARETRSDAIELLIRARYAVFGVVLALTAFFLISGKRVDYEQSIQSFFADDDPAIVEYSNASRLFGNDNVIFICYKDNNIFSKEGMDRIADLAARVGPKSVRGILDVQSLDAMPLLWRIDDGLFALESMPRFLRERALGVLKSSMAGMDAGAGALSIGGAVRSADAGAIVDLKRRVLGHPLMKGMLIDSAGESAAIVARLRRTDEYDMKATVKELRAIADDWALKRGLPAPAIVGPPVLLADGYANIERDGARLAILGMGLIALVTFSATRSLWWAGVPILAGWSVWLATEWILATLGLKLSLSGGPLVAQIIVLTMPAAGHLAIHFRESRARTRAREPSARETLQAVISPILWCAATGALGYGVLLTSNLVPVRQFGAILGGCTLIAALLTLALAPIAMLPPFSAAFGFELALPAAADPLASAPRTMNRLTDWVQRRSVWIVASVFAIVVPVVLGMRLLEYESNYINVFRKHARVLRDYHEVENQLGGIGLFVLAVPLENGLESRALGRLQEFERRVKAAAERNPRLKFAQIISAATVLDPEHRLDTRTEDARNRFLKTKLDLIGLSKQAELMRGFWAPSEKLARIVIRIPEQQLADDKDREFNLALESARSIFGPKSFLTGLSFLMTRTARGVTATQWSTMIASLGGIVLMLAVALKGPKLAVLALLPSVLAIVFVLGLMGWTGVKLDIATALVASVALGLSVDDTFHCLLQFQRARKQMPFSESLKASYEVTGPGVLLSSFAIAIGFAALWFSEFVPFSNFGVMVCIATAGSSLGNLILLPACLVVGERLQQSRRRPPIPEPMGDATPAESASCTEASRSV